MQVSFLTLHLLSMGIALAMFYVYMKAHQDQNVSDFWAEVLPETSTYTYFGTMWLLAAIAASLALADTSIVAGIGQFAGEQMADGHFSSVLLGAAIFSVWLTATMACGVFAACILWLAGYEALRRALGRPKRITVVG